MRSRRLPLGSPSRKEGPEKATEDGNASLNATNSNHTHRHLQTETPHETLRAKMRQSPPSGIPSPTSSKSHGKPLKPRRMGRGLPLTSRSTSPSKLSPTTPPENPSASQLPNQKKSDDNGSETEEEDISLIQATVVKKEPNTPRVASPKEKKKPAAQSPTVTPAATTAATASETIVPVPKTPPGHHKLSSLREEDMVKKKTDFSTPLATATKMEHSRKRPASSSSSATPTTNKQNTHLVALRPGGTQIQIKLVVNHKPFTNPKLAAAVNSPSLAAKEETLASTRPVLGQDGNQYNCQVCGELGNVICCDGCPKVYHKDCIPVAARDLETNEPWYCPSCQEKKTHRPRRLSTERKEEESLYVCFSCEKSMDLPYYNDAGQTLCTTCFSAEHSSTSEDPIAVRSKRERKRKASYDAADLSSPPQDKAKKKKKKKKARKESIDLGSPAPSEASFDLPSLVIPPPNQSGISRATPAFIFFMVENRIKIERDLSRKLKNWNRMGRGGEKNALVAKEAALAWAKLKPPEQKRFMDMSMRDFEAKIINWKEDKSIREMHASTDVLGSEHSVSNEQRLLEDDEKLTWKRHQRLYLSTSVGSKPFKTETDQAYNRVLQDLLHDMRFHPLPMLNTERPEEKKDEHQEKEDSRVLIPFFDVHGPVSTSVGDSCMGCVRSWNHYCPVLQRRVPAVEHRARLQPPMSSLLATRVGLGLRPHLTREKSSSSVAKGENDEEENQLFSWRESKQQQDMSNLKVVQSSTLDDPNERMDDVVYFVEETIAMKVPEPARPSEGKPSSKLRSLPISTQKSEENALKKCGRCRAIIEGDTGCVQCRRAQLVINMAKRPKGEGKLMKVHTSMLGRYNVKDLADSQSPADEAVANAMLRERWTPSSILPPYTKYAPNPHHAPSRFAHEDNKPEKKVEHESTESNDAKEDKKVELSSNGDSSAVTETGPETPIRSSSRRSVVAPNDTFEPHERQEVMEKNRKAVSLFQKRMVNIACSGLLLALVRRDPLKLFDQPVTDEAYYDVIKTPMFFCNMRDKILNNQYPTLGGFANDVKQMFENAQEYNLPTSIYAKTAVELHELYAVMHKRASYWVAALKDAYADHLNKTDEPLEQLPSGVFDVDEIEEAFGNLEKDWPEAYQLLKNGDWLKNCAAADFVRSKENEIAFFGSLAVSRVAAAAEASLAPYTDASGTFGTVTKRNYREDKELRDHVDKASAKITGPLNLSTPSTWREESVHRLLRKVQSRRLDRLTASEQGCARCDGIIVDQDVKLNMKAEAAIGKLRKTEDSDLPRVDGSRIDLTTGRGSANVRTSLGGRRKQSAEEQFGSVEDSCVSVRGSRIHGLGLFSDQEFRAGDVVAEYVGEYIGNDEFETRESIYRKNRTQDYSFRLSSDLVIDATRRGGPGRYANHNCTPNCASKIIPGSASHPNMKRVMIVALRNIHINEEITYDYQFPLEQDLSARIPCNCRSDDCRGFMNWDLPEKGSNNRAVLVQKRGANMRDRIRRLNRPLKRDSDDI